MGVVEAKWRERQCRTEEAVYFADDRVAELCGAPEHGFRADLRAPVELLIRQSPEGWTHLDPLCQTQEHGFTVTAGCASWEGAGFVALEDAEGRLLWLLHLRNSEPFIEVSCDGENVHAISEEYPRRFKWHIPIAAPEMLGVSPTES